MGSEKYVYFEVDRDQAAHTRSMEALVEGAGSEEEGSRETGSASFEDLMVARVSAESGVKHGEKLLLEIDASKVSLFDPETEVPLRFRATSVGRAASPSSRSPRPTEPLYLPE